MSNKVPSSDSLVNEFLAKEPTASIKTTYLICGMALVMIIWSALFEVDEFTRASGRVVPSQDVQMVQNLEGGIVAEILGREGMLVQQGQAILKLDDTRFSSSSKEQTIEIDYLNERRHRLYAEANNLEYVPLSSSYANNELSLYQSRQALINKELDIVDNQIAQKQLAQSDAQSRRRSLMHQRSLLKQEYDLTKPLVLQGAVSQVDVLRLERKLEEMAQEIASTKVSEDSIESEISELTNSKKSIEAKFISSVQSEINEVDTKIALLQQSSQRVGDQLDRTVIRAPVKGTIKVLNYSTIGGVVQPGTNIAEIVPFEDQLMVEVKVRPQDIAFIHPGQRASVKVTAYDYSIHGDLKGNVAHISPDSIIDEQDESFYLVKIITDDPALKSSFQSLPIIPGMTVEVGILTGKKSVLDFILKPITKTASNALVER